MGEVTIYKESDRGNTVISNCFIDYYLADANDAQIKVYLYLIRMLTANEATSISDIADKFNHTEKDVNRALRFWETKGLLSLDYDENGAIKGIHLMPPKPLKTEIQQDFVPFVTLMPAMEAREEKKEFIKPDYSLDDLKSFKEKDSTQEIVCIAEQYLKKTLSSNDIRSLFFITDTLNFSLDLLDYLLEYCADAGKNDFKYIERVAISWAEKNIKTPSEAKLESNKHDKRFYKIMNALGKNSSPTDKEAEFINRWLHDYKYDLNMIIEACDRTVMATDQHRFEYAEKILSSWFKDKVQTKEDIAAHDLSFHNSKAPKQSRKKFSPDNFSEFATKDYDFEAIEKKLLSKK